MEVPLPIGRVYNPLLGQIALYEECLKAGTRLPLFYFYIKCLKSFRIFLCTIVPNSWHHICGFMAKCLSAGIKPTLNLFRYVFYFAKHS